VVDPFGRVLFEAGREETRQVISLDLTQVQAARADYHYLNDRRLTLPGETVEHADGRREWLIR
jgi:Predicted amidohydrolase